MTSLDDAKWVKIVASIDFALQPIVNIMTGTVYGFEALLRNSDFAGFESIDQLFNDAYDDGVLHQVDLVFREKAIKKFSKIEKASNLKLFFNLDNRVLKSADYKPGYTLSILEKYELPRGSICFEVSEKHEIDMPREMLRMLNSYRSQGFKIAMDDYGTGFSGLQMLYYTEPDCIKIDRFFVAGMDKSRKKKLFVGNTVEIAHILGIKVIAEGVETATEYNCCREIGCDFIQGYFVERPQIEIKNLKINYSEIRNLCKVEKRNRMGSDKELIMSRLEYIEPVQKESGCLDIFEKFKEVKETFFPVVNFTGEPEGIIREKSFKDYAYSRYGTELLRNLSLVKGLDRFLSRFPSADINTQVEIILKIYSQNDDLEGIIFTDDSKYIGFLSASSLLKIINEKNINVARNQNPLSMLPGNFPVSNFVSEALNDPETGYVMVYFDFDNFKAFNDKYGFRRGDRVILLFAGLLKRFCLAAERFAGHIGGDDFFAGVKGESLPKLVKEVEKLASKFTMDAESFYDGDAIREGHITSVGRSGEVEIFPLITVSSAIIYLLPGREISYTEDEIGRFLAGLKKQAKQESGGIAIANIQENIQERKMSGENRMGLTLHS